MLSLTTATWELYCTVLYCNVLYCTALYCTVLYCTAGGQLHPRQHADLLHRGLRPRRGAPARPAVRPHRHGAGRQRHLHHPRQQVMQPSAFVFRTLCTRTSHSIELKSLICPKYIFMNCMDEWMSMWMDCVHPVAANPHAIPTGPFIPIKDIQITVLLGPKICTNCLS